MSAINPPDKAFILAAGKGTRLRPHTDTMPKPMVDIAGKSIIKRTIEKLAAAGVNKIVINTHHLADVIESHLSAFSFPEIIISREDALLDTGGGIKKVISHFGKDPFFVINGDALWDDAPGENAFTRLADRWDNATMDILLLLEPKEYMAPSQFVGDYHLLPDGAAIRAKDKTGNHMFAGIRIAHPRIFDGVPDGVFSFLQLMDAAESAGRLYALPHNGAWYHISTPEDLADANRIFQSREAGIKGA